MQATAKDAILGNTLAKNQTKTKVPEALDTAHRLLSALTSLTVDYRNHAIQISASFGITHLGRQDQRLEDLLHRADRALYRSKELGRCQVNLDAPL
ncbi:MAG: diguanylate cyclase [Marinobacter sp.]|nr:diguanylate cyclase [Marinobacter sp.]